MGPPVRVGGRFESTDGATVIWSVAEGRRGRRWRWGRTERDGATLAVLLETAISGRPTRLEVSGPAGLLTLHPEPDEREAHGNVVGTDGVRPLAFAWSPDHVFDVAGLPCVAEACVAGPQAPGARPALVVHADLAVSTGVLSLALADDGLPATGERWPLE